jgi:glycosyltransferase involved in cell wall biosynthesis
MKIAMIGSRGIPVTYSGIETHLEQLCPRLVKKGHQLVVYCKKDIDYLEDLFQGVNLRKVPSITSKHFETLTRSFLSVLTELFSKNDIVHFHALGPSVFAILPRIFHKQTVVTVHGLDWQRAKWGAFASSCLRFGEWTSARICHTVICVSQTLRDYYRAKYGIKAYYIPNGVNMPYYLPPETIKLKGLDCKNYILFLSRLVPEKGCHYLIKAFNQLNTSMKLVIAGGSGHSEEYVQQLKKCADGNDQIIFTGFVSGKILIELFSNAYAYVLPSEVEGLPISLLEAMSYENCVVTSDIPENIEIVNGYGFTFKNKDIGSLQVVLDKLLKNPALVAEKGKSGKRLVQQEYNWDKIANQTECLYRKLLSAASNH